MNLLELPQRAFRWLWSKLGRLAPAGSRRRDAVKQFYAMLRHLRYGSLPPRPGRVSTLPDPFDRNELNRYLAPFGIQFPLRLLGPVTPVTAARRVLELLLSDKELHERFPTALRDGGRGEFARWLFSAEAECLGVSGDAARIMVQALDGPQSMAVLHWYDCIPDVRHRFPLAFTPADLATFVFWLLTHHGALGFRVDDVLWFLLQTSEDPACGLAETFRRQPSWQETTPHGLTRFGWDELKRWVARHENLSGDWIARAQRPDELRPVEELHWLTVGRPDLRRQFPDVLTNPQSARALAQRLRQDACGDESGWRRALEKDLASNRPGVNVLSHFHYPSGLRVATLNAVAALELAGLDASCRSVPTAITHDVPARERYLDLHPYRVTLSFIAPGPLANNCYSRGGLARQKNTCRIGYWYWELEDVPASCARHARDLNEIWAPTRFVGDTLRKALAIPVVDMLAGMRLPPDVRLPREHFGLPTERFLFLFVFDMRSVMERKNPLAIVDAFRRAFTPRDPVALAIKVARGDHDPAGLQVLRDACAIGGIHLIDAMHSHDELFGLMNACDAYVSLHRSEGFGLTMAEAMALGKPVIATAYSGNLDFMTPSNSLLVSYEKVPLRKTVLVYPRGCHWAEPSVDHAAELMRWVMNHRAEATALGQRAARDVRATLSLQAAGRRMASRLQDLAKLRVAQPRGIHAA